MPLVWTAIVVLLCLAFAGTWTGTLLATWITESRPPLGPIESPHAIAELERDGTTIKALVRGTPGSQVVLLADGQPVRIATLDESGRTTIEDLPAEPSVEIAIASLVAPAEILDPAPTSTPTATSTATATSTPARSASATTPAEEASTPSATATLPPVDVATATPRRRPSPKAIDRRRGRSATPPVLHLVTDAGPRIAITFDGNGSSNGTADLLEQLEGLDLDITLFVTGRFIAKYPTLVRQAVLAGHEVGSHTYSHPHLTTYAKDRRQRTLSTVDRSFLHDQLRRTEAAFRAATGRPMAPLWRAPFGEENSELRRWALELGYLHVRWSSLGGASLDSLDWVADEHSRMYRDSKRMVDRLLAFPRLEGGIVLMHLATEREEPPWTDLPRFVAELRRREVKPVKVSEMLLASETWRPWFERAQRRHDELFGD